MPLYIKKTLKSAAGRAAEAAGLIGRHSRNVMTIVAFHRVNDELSNDDLTCPTDKFIAFCQFFVKHFRVVRLSDQIEARRQGLDMGGTLSVTFDDGYADNFHVAAPILKRLKIPATFFVTTAFIGSTAVPPWDDKLPIPQKWMNWDQLRILLSHGFEIGNHTDQHLNLGTSDLSLLRADLELSRDKLHRELGRRIGLFAYPFGGQTDISDTSRELVRQAGFDCCLSCFGGVNPATSDRFHLRRIHIGDWFTSPHQFALEFLLGKV